MLSHDHIKIGQIQYLIDYYDHKNNLKVTVVKRDGNTLLEYITIHYARIDGYWELNITNSDAKYSIIPTKTNADVIEQIIDILRGSNS